MCGRRWAAWSFTRVDPRPSSSSRPVCWCLGSSWQSGWGRTLGRLAWCCYSGYCRSYDTIITTDHQWWQWERAQKETTTAFLKSCGDVHVFANQIQFPQWTSHLWERVVLYPCSWLLFLGQCLQHFAFHFSASSLSVMIYKYSFIHSTYTR